MADFEDLRLAAEKAQNKGNYAEAERLWLSLIPLKEEDIDNLSAHALEKLCECLWSQGKFVEAVPQCNRLLAHHRRILGNDHVDTGSMIANLALLYHAQSLYNEAAAIYEQAINVKAKHLNADHPELLRLIGLHAEVLGHLLNPKKLSQQANSQMWSKSGDRQPVDPMKQTVSFELENLSPIQQWDVLKERAEAYFNQGKFDSAELSWSAALQLAEENALDGYHICLPLERLCDLFEKQDQYKKAFECSRRTLEIKKRVFGPYHLSVALNLNDIARLLYYAYDLGQAETYALECLHVYEKVHGGHHASVASAANNLAMLYHIQKKYAEAEPYYTHAINMRIDLLGADHPDTIKVMGEYANLLKATGRQSKAQEVQACIEGMVTGSWKPIPTGVKQPCDLGSHCLFCGAELKGLYRCPICGTEAKTPSPSKADQGSETNKG